MGFPVLAISFTSSSCAPGNPMFARQLDSPLKSFPYPTKSKTLFAWLAAVIASWNKLLSTLLKSLYPFAKVILVLVNAAFKLVKGVIESWALPSPAQHPIWFYGSSAKAPIIARLEIEGSTGNVLFLFWSKTGHCRAWFLAAYLWAGLKIIFCL